MKICFLSSEVQHDMIIFSNDICYPLIIYLPDWWRNWICARKSQEKWQEIWQKGVGPASNRRWRRWCVHQEKHGQSEERKQIQTCLSQIERIYRRKIKTEHLQVSLEAIVVVKTLTNTGPCSSWAVEWNGNIFSLACR